MGWSDFNPKNAVDNFVDSAKDFIRDPIGSFTDTFLNVFTLGAYGYLKDKLADYIQGLIPEQTFQDRQRSVRSSDEPKTVIYGKVRTGGHLVYIEDDGKDKILLWMCHVLAGHEVEEIEAVYFNEVKYATSNGPGVNGFMNRDTGTQFGNNILCWSVHGNRSSAFIPSANVDYTDDSYDGTFSPPNWTSNHRLSNQSYVWTLLIFDKETFGDVGVPTIKFDVRGKNDIYNPRTLTTGYTDNHALVCLDVLRWDRSFNIANSEINMQPFIDAANIADEQVASGVGTTEKRYTCNGTFKMLTAPLEILESVARAGASFPVYSQGEWSIVPGSYSAPVMDLNEDDLIGGLSFQPGPGKSNRHNVATGTFIDPDQSYESVGFSELYVSDYVTQDGEVLEKDFQFAWTNSPTMARRLAKIDIERNRFGTSLSAVWKFKALRLSPGDRVNVFNSRLGWNPKIFRVESSEVSFSTGVKLDLREDAQEIYDWEEGDALALDPPPVLSIPNGLQISAPASLDFAEELYRTIVRNAVKVRLTLTWPDVPSALAFDIQIKGPGETVFRDAATFWQDTTLAIPDVEDGLHEFRIRSINGIGRKSDWLTLPYSVVGKSERPPNITTVFVEKRKLRWEYTNAPVDLAGFLVRFQNGNRTFWNDATPMHENIVTETVFDVSQYSGIKTFLVKAVDTTGNESETAAFVVQGLGDPIIDNVIDDQSEAPTWTGTKTNCFVNVSDELEAEEVGGFYAESDSQFYAQDTTIKLYSAEYLRLEYEYSYTVAAQDAGSSLSVVETIADDFNDKLDYKPPGYTGDWLAFPGSVDADEGTYSFRFTVPAQQLPEPPKVTDIVTSLDVADVLERFNDVTIASGGTRLSLTKTYRDILNVSLTLQSDGGTAATVKYLDKDEVNGPLIQCFDNSGVAVAGTIDAIVQGF